MSVCLRFRHSGVAGDLVGLDLGEACDFAEVLALQRAMRHDGLARPEERGRVVLLTCSHRPTLSFGYRCDLERELTGRWEEVERRGIQVVQLERGGRGTFHGPGQQMFYVLCHLPSWRLGVRAYVDLLHRVTAQVVSEYVGPAFSVTWGGDLPLGVWIYRMREPARKIAAVGIHVSRGATIQGVCLNVEGDLSGFDLIDPCGERGRPITSLTAEGVREVSRMAMVDRWGRYFWQALSGAPRLALTTSSTFW